MSTGPKIERSPLNSVLLHGDCLELLDDLPAGGIDLVFTSPPYFNARPEYSSWDSYESYLSFMGLVLEKSYRVLAEGRFFVMNISPVLVAREKRSESSRRYAVPFDMHRLLCEAGFEFIDDIIWLKPEGAGWASGRGRRFSADRTPLQYKTVPVTEYVLVYRKATDKLIDWNIRNHHDLGLVEGSKIRGDYEITNVWEIQPETHSEHPAPFPVGLSDRVIRYYSFKDDVVLDPFGGSGTTGVSAMRLGRRYILMEKSGEYVEMARKRLSVFDNDLFSGD